MLFGVGAYPLEGMQASATSSVVGNENNTSLSATYAGGNTEMGQTIQKLYTQRQGRPLWQASPIRWRGAAQKLIEGLQNLRWDGLDPQQFHLSKLQGLIQQPWSMKGDVLFTEAALTAGRTLLYGHMHDQPEWPSHWQQATEKISSASVMLRAIQQGRPQAGLDALRPQYTQYRALRQKLRTRETTSQPLPNDSFPNTPTLARGDSSLVVPALRHYLIRAGDWTVHQLWKQGGGPTPYHLDPTLESAVRNFQARYGLATDGVVGPKTWKTLNQGRRHITRLIRLNLERWRWLPRQQPSKWVMVNIPEFKVRAIRERETTWSSKIIVGREWDPTPVLVDTIQHAVFAPYWNIPHSIAVYDKLPKLQEDSTYFRKMGMEVYSTGSSEGGRLSPDAIAWDSLGPGNFPYRLRQQPGPQNALGEVKFLFPNKFSVYMHGTPQTHLFQAAERTFSAGCIRVSEPLELAHFLLPQKQKTMEQIEHQLQEGTYEERWVRVEGGVPVFVTYQTAWVENGRLHIRPDIYEYDRELAQKWGETLQPPSLVTNPLEELPRAESQE